MALTTHIALLRGVNVGGNKPVAMAALRAMAADLGFLGPRTLLQSGNLVFASRPTGAELEALLERELALRLGLVARVFVRTADEWRAILAANPLAEMARDDPSHTLVMPLEAVPDPAKLAEMRAAIAGRELVEARGRELYLAYPDGVGPSRLTNALIERRLGLRGTARNWNTALKLAELAGG